MIESIPNSYLERVTCHFEIEMVAILKARVKRTSQRENTFLGAADNAPTP